MISRCPVAAKFCLLAASYAVLASCAAARPATAPPQPIETQTGVTAGTVVAVRQVDGAAAGGCNAVMAALGMSATATPIAGQETVIEKTDGNPISLAARGAPQTLQPGEKIVMVPVGTGLAIRHD